MKKLNLLFAFALLSTFAWSQYYTHDYFYPGGSTLIPWSFVKTTHNPFYLDSLGNRAGSGNGFAGVGVQTITSVSPYSNGDNYGLNVFYSKSNGTTLWNKLYNLQPGNGWNYNYLFAGDIAEDELAPSPYDGDIVVVGCAYGQSPFFLRLDANNGSVKASNNYTLPPNFFWNSGSKIKLTKYIDGGCEGAMTNAFYFTGEIINSNDSNDKRIFVIKVDYLGNLIWNQFYQLFQPNSANPYKASDVHVDDLMVHQNACGVLLTILGHVGTSNLLVTTKSNDPFFLGIYACDGTPGVNNCFPVGYPCLLCKFHTPTSPLTYPLPDSTHVPAMLTSIDIDSANPTNSFIAAGSVYPNGILTTQGAYWGPLSFPSGFITLHNDSMTGPNIDMKGSFNAMGSMEYYVYAEQATGDSCSSGRHHVLKLDSAGYLVSSGVFAQTDIMNGSKLDFGADDRTGGTLNPFASIAVYGNNCSGNAQRVKTIYYNGAASCNANITSFSSTDLICEADNISVNWDQGFTTAPLNVDIYSASDTTICNNSIDSTGSNAKVLAPTNKNKIRIYQDHNEYGVEFLTDQTGAQQNVKDNNVQAEIIIFDLLGRVHYDQKVSANPNEIIKINTSGFDRGFYFLTVIKGYERTTQKFIIN